MIVSKAIGIQAVLAIGLLLALASCGTQDGASPTTSSDSPATTDAKSASSDAQSSTGTGSSPGDGKNDGAQAYDSSSYFGQDVASSDAAFADTTATPPASADASAADASAADVPTPDAAPDVAAPICNTVDPTVLYLSADDSNSMASATIARGLVNQGQLVDKPIRTYEFLNYYDFAYPAAEKGHVAVSAELLKVDDATYHLQVGVRAPDTAAADRRRLNVVLAVDTSSSLGWGKPGQTGIELARAACTQLVASLEKDDKFSLVTWGGGVAVPVNAVTLTGPDTGKLATACANLQASGATNLSEGLNKAYLLAKQGFSAERMNRVILLSDGGSNVGEQDAKVIAEAAKDANGEAIYLMGVGVGDPWNYNDALMNAVTDAGKGAYVFIDQPGEAETIFGSGLLRHTEVAARDVQVELTLPPTFAMQQFFGEQYSTNANDVEPQHLAANDAMIFNQIIHSCDPSKLPLDVTVTVVATWKDPQTYAVKKDSYSAKFSDLLAKPSPLLLKGDAVVAYAEALKDVQKLTGKAAQARIDTAIAVVDAAQKQLKGDKDLAEIHSLLATYRATFDIGQATPWSLGGTGANPIGGSCSCNGTGSSLEAMACALDLCDSSVLLGMTYTSPTGSTTAGTFAAVSQFGDTSNGLKPRVGNSYALVASGPATGTSHSQDVGGSAGKDPYSTGKNDDVHNAMEWRLHLKAPAGANGLRLRHVFFSEEYDDYVGSAFNDKFYLVLEAGSTNGGKPTVINYTDCRAPDTYSDFTCSAGMQFCNPRARYCFIAINTALSECCWLGGCPNGKAKTSIAGTGFSCAANQSSDSASAGSSTGWLQTEWPIEPGEDFYLTVHIHDTGDGIFDSEVLLDGLQFVGSVTPGTWSLPPM